jgi:hypothetical protein
MELTLFLVSRFGNPQEGADGKNTVLLVRADTVARAAELADDVLRGSGTEAIVDWSQVIQSLGKSAPFVLAREDEAVLAYSCDLNLGYWGFYPSWARWDEGGPWIYQGPCRKCANWVGQLHSPMICPRCGEEIK